MAQQSAKFLQKCVKKVLKGEKLVGVFDYLNELPTILNIKNKATSPSDYTNIA